MNLMEMPGYETVIGDGRHLTDFMKNLIEEGIITESEAMSIKDKLRNQFEKGFVKEKELIPSVYMYCFDLEYETFFKNVLAKNEICPVCLEKMDYKEGVCNNCDFDVGLANLSLEDFRTMEKFANFVESHKPLRDTRDGLLKHGYGGDHLYTDLLFDTYLDDSLKKEYDNLNLNTWVDLDDMYGDFEDEDTYENNDYVIHVSELDMCISHERHQYRLIPKDINSYFMPGNLNRFRLYSYIGKGYDVDEALENLAYVPHYLAEDLFYQSFGEGYLTHNACRANWYDFSKDLSIQELRLFLEINNVDSSGSKEELISRIFESGLKLEEFKSEKTFLTQQAYDYLKEHQWIQFYEDHLWNYDFFEFSEYFYDHDGSIEEIALDYLDEHIELTYDSSDFDYIMRTYLAKSNLCYSMGNLKEGVTCDMRMFLLNMNPIGFDMRFSFRFSVPIFPIHITHLKEFKLKYGEERILESFEENWNFMNFDSSIIPKDAARNILITALNSEDNEWGKKVYDEYFKPIFGDKTYYW